MTNVTRGAMLATALMGLVGHPARAELIYDNSLSPPVPGLVGPFTRSQIGDEVTAGGTDRFVSLLEIGVTSQGVPVSADLQAFLYVNDGPNGQPGTLLWESEIQNHVDLPGANQFVPFVVPDVLVPNTFTWAIQISNAVPAVGMVSVGTPSIGTSTGIGWFGGPADWGQDSGNDGAYLLVRISAVPEPSSLAQAGIASLIGLILWARKPRQAKVPKQNGSRLADEVVPDRAAT